MVASLVLAALPFGPKGEHMSTGTQPSVNAPTSSPRRTGDRPQRPPTTSQPRVRIERFESRANATYVPVCSGWGSAGVSVFRHAAESSRDGSASAEDTSAGALPSVLPLLSYQVSSPNQDDHELPGLQFGLQFTTVRPSSPEHARGV